MTMLVEAAEAGNTRRTAAQIEEAIRSRAAVDQAKGILMQRLGCDRDEAFDRLRRISQTQHVKLTEVARRVIETRAGPERAAGQSRVMRLSRGLLPYGRPRSGAAAGAAT